MDEKELPQEWQRREIDIEIWKFMISAGISIKEWGIGISVSDYSEKDWGFRAYKVDFHFFCFWLQIAFN